LEENQKTLAEKDAALARLSKEGEALRARFTQLQQQAQQQQQQKQQQAQANANANANAAATATAAAAVAALPRRVLLRVDVGGRVWLLLEPEEAGGPAEGGSGDYWKAFRSV
jgi:hypothetical protein